MKLLPLLFLLAANTVQAANPFLTWQVGSTNGGGGIADGNGIWTNSASRVRLITTNANSVLELQANDGAADGTIEFWLGGTKRISASGGSIFPATSGYDLGTSVLPFQGAYLNGAVGLFLGDREIFSSSGSPEGISNGNIGALYLRTDGGSGTTLYTKISGAGNTGWEALGGGSASSNWAASGTTNSTLAGTAFLNNAIFTNGISIGTGISLIGDTTGIVAQRSGTTAQQQRIYGTYTDSSNYERMGYGFDGTRFIAVTASAGTGIARELHFGTDFTRRWGIQTNGHWIAITDNVFDIGATSTLRPRTINVGTDGNFGGRVNATSVVPGFITIGAIGSGVYLNESADGVLFVSNAATTDFSRIQLGGTTTAFPAIKRNGTAVNIRLADDSAGAPLTSSTFTTGLTASTAVAPTIASAGTIAPTTPIVFVSGTTTVVTITAPSPISATGGSITIIPTGIFTTTTAGNIALASTTVVSKALIMHYDATTTKWYPSY